MLILVFFIFCLSLRFPSYLEIKFLEVKRGTVIKEMERTAWEANHDGGFCHLGT